MDHGCSSPCATLNTCKTKEQNLIAIILHIQERGCANVVLKTYLSMGCYSDRALADEGEGCLSFGWIYIYDGDWYWSFGQYINDSVEDFGDTAQVDCE